jgi:TonB-linked SusC/RagA family outer membrane protein
MKNLYIKYAATLAVMIAATGMLMAQEADSSLIVTKHKPAEEIVYPGRLINTSGINHTGASGSASGDELYQTTANTLPNSMAGRIAGLGVKIGNGNPLNNTAQWLIRGIGSYTYGNYNESKIYVDGFEVTNELMVFMTPSEIESITVLKDAAELSTFGMTGSNGVIWITTKRGGLGKLKVDANVRTSVTQPVNVYKPLGSAEYAKYYNIANSNDNNRTWTPYYSDAMIEDYMNGIAPDIDWYKAVMKPNGNYSDASISISGGIPSVRYYVTLGYANNQGLLNVNNTDATSNVRMSSYNARANLDIALSIFEAKIDVSGRLEDCKEPSGGTWNLLNRIAFIPSNTYWIYDDPEATHFSGTMLFPDNPVGSLKGLGWSLSRTRHAQANFTLKEKLDFITKGLYLQQSFSFYSSVKNGYGKTRNYSRWMDGATTTTDQDSPLTAGWYVASGLIDWKQGELTLGYKHSFENHHFNAATAWNVSDRKEDGRFGYKYHSLNWLGRANYNYDSRYTLEAGFSYYGSDAYAPGNRWGFYPSLSAAWLISNEKWMKGVGAIDLLKLRASIGKTGSNQANSSVNVNDYDSYGRFLYQQYFTYSDGIYTGSTVPYYSQSGISPKFVANPNAFAEKSLKYNIGLDATLFHGLDVSLDAFLDKRSDILTVDYSVLGYYGNNLYLRNIGKMTNKGLEISVAYNGKLDAAGYSLFGTAGHAINRVDYKGETPTAYAYNATTGTPYGTQYGLIADGFYNIDDFEADGSLKSEYPQPAFGPVQPGDIKYRDLNNDGFISSYDVTKIGDPSNPKWDYSLGAQINWKGWDFGAMFRGAAGCSINLLWYPEHTIPYRDNANAFPVARDAWAYYPDQGIDNRATAKFPRLTASQNGHNYQYSTQWVVKNNFLRLQYIELGYDFSHTLIHTKDISRMRLFVNATNPVTWSKLLSYYNMDPETGYNYPAVTYYTAGLSVTF